MARARMRWRWRVAGEADSKVDLIRWTVFGVLPALHRTTSIFHLSGDSVVAAEQPPKWARLTITLDTDYMSAFRRQRGSRPRPRVRLGYSNVAV